MQTRHIHTALLTRLRSGLLALLLGIVPSLSAIADGALLQNDPAGNITQRTGPVGTTTYGYDALNRLNSEAGPAKTQNLTYDANGNRLSDGAGNLTYSPSSNRMATRLGTAISYDAAGNMTADGSGKTYRYNQAGQLSQVLQGATLLASYYYNYQGERTRKVTTTASPQGAQTVIYHYDQFGKLSVETRDDGTPLRTYVWRDDAPLAQIDYIPSRRILYYEVDHLNTPRAASDQSGKVLWRWESDAFGSTPPNEDPDGDGIKTTVNLRFPGQYYDQETGLHYNYFRDYDPKVGRYTSSDPIGLAGGLNTYAYVGGNPVNYADPLGLAKSGQTIQVPGTNTTVRIDPPAPTRGDSQRHAHVCQKGCEEIVVNQDGTGSHGTDPNKIKNKKVLKYLANKGIRIALKCGLPVFFAYDWYDQGFGYAVDEATWPASETWAD